MSSTWWQLQRHELRAQGLRAQGLGFKGLGLNNCIVLGIITGASSLKLQVPTENRSAMKWAPFVRASNAATRKFGTSSTKRGATSTSNLRQSHQTKSQNQAKGSLRSSCTNPTKQHQAESSPRARHFRKQEILPNTPPTPLYFSPPHILTSSYLRSKRQTFG